MRLFADTLYWVAIANPLDPWHEAAKNANPTPAAAQLLTTDEVLTEFLTALASGGSYLRQRTVAVVHRILEARTVTVLPQSRLSFLAGMALYESRPDKAYSLVDCISMNAMRAQGIQDILTNDHHFTQEGFNVRIQR